MDNSQKRKTNQMVRDYLKRLDAPRNDQQTTEALLTCSPIPITDASTLVAQLARRARLLRSVIEQTLKEQMKKPEKEPLALRGLYKALQQTLLPNLKEADFADLYAQTLVYGLFAARYYASPNNAFTRSWAERIIPASIPFLRRLFDTLNSQLLESELEWLIDDLTVLLGQANMDALLQDFAKRSGEQESVSSHLTKDPVIHFYEDFLAAYDPQLRKLRGVYYTPEPVVQFMVRAVDAVLKKNLGLKSGLEDEKVLVLDPACGTGSFLYEIIQYLYEQFCKSRNQGRWAGFVSDKLLHRLFGFEVLMAPYTIAHLKLTLELKAMGITTNQRLQIFLTNALDPAREPCQLPLGEFLTQEAQEAADIKEKKPILVVIGNPPYSMHSANPSRTNSNSKTKKHQKLTWIGGLIEDYKKVDGKDLQERNPKALQDDYVKFIRFAEWRIEETGQGVMAFITNHAYLSNLTFRGMRSHLLNTFHQLYIINLHGNARLKEHTPDGLPDENVFDIQQGVAILIAIRLPDKPTGEAEVYYYDVWGSRDQKYKFLRETLFDHIPWKQITPCSPGYFFVPRDVTPEEKEEYIRGWCIPDIFPKHSMGITTARDKLTIHRSPKEVWKIVCDFVKKQNPEEARKEYQLGEDTRDWSVARAQEDLKKAGVPNESVKEKCIIPILYRPFSTWYTFYTGKSRGFHSRPRYEIMRHLSVNTEGEGKEKSPSNLALIVGRAGSAVGDKEWNIVFVTMYPVDMNIFRRGGGEVFPLYLLPKDPKKHEDSKKPKEKPLFSEEATEDCVEPNLSKEYLDELSKIVERPHPRQVLNYIYAILHSPTYRRRYSEFLKEDFPRIPLPPTKEIFEKLASLGNDLIELHLLTHEKVKDPICKYPIEGNNMVQKVEYKDSERRVYLNEQQYFDDVPPEVWSYRVGGYAVCENWLEQRKSTNLSDNEIETYQKMVTALRYTLDIQTEIDEVVKKAWPDKSELPKNETK